MAFVYKRIANPFMPQGTPDKTNAATPLYAPGEVGAIFTDQNTGTVYQRALIDSGATSSTGIGHSPQQGEIMYWKNQALGIVTNDKAQCDATATAAPNRIAGIVGPTAPTVTAGVNGTDGQPLQYMTDLIIGSGPGATQYVQCSSTPTAGQLATGNTASNTANTVANNVGTAAPSQIVGVFTGGSSITLGGHTVYPIDVALQFND